MSAAQLRRHLADIAADRYRPSGRFAYYFARGKLSDPAQAEKAVAFAEQRLRS